MHVPRPGRCGIASGPTSHCSPTPRYTVRRPLGNVVAPRRPSVAELAEPLDISIPAVRKGIEHPGPEPGRRPDAFSSASCREPPSRSTRESRSPSSRWRRPLVPAVRGGSGERRRQHDSADGLTGQRRGPGDRRGASHVERRGDGREHGRGADAGYSYGLGIAVIVALDSALAVLIVPGRVGPTEPAMVRPEAPAPA